MTDELRAALHRDDANADIAHDPQDFLREVQRRVRVRRRWRLVPAAAVLLVLSVVGAQLVRTPHDATPAAGPRQVTTDLVGAWTVTSPLDSRRVTLILGDEVAVFLSCGSVSGQWGADSSGAFVANLSSTDQACYLGPTKQTVPIWLSQATGYRGRGRQIDLLGPTGATLATLTVGAPPQPTSSYVTPNARQPVLTDALRARLADAPPLPAGLASATAASLVGHWKPVSSGTTYNPRGYVNFRLGTWEGSDGCNASGGRLEVGAQGSMLTTFPGSTAVGCLNSPGPSWVAAARRAGFDHGLLVLLSVNGRELGRLQRKP